MFDRRTLPLSALRAFESAGRHLHLGNAGNELGVTHGAISHQVRALETKLGVKLFERTGNRLKLTEAGERLLQAVEQGFDCILDGALHLTPDNLMGKLVIGCTPTTGACWAVPHIGEFQLHYPQIEIQVVEISPQQKRIPREIDIAICYGEPDKDDRRLELLVATELFPVCSPRALHGLPSMTRTAHLSHLPLLYDNQNSWQEWFTKMGIEPPEHSRKMHFYSTHLTLSAARNGYGAALCNPFEVQDDLREGRLVKLVEKGVPEAHNYYLLTASEDKQSLKAKLFEDWVKRKVAS